MFKQALNSWGYLIRGYTVELQTKQHSDTDFWMGIVNAFPVCFGTQVKITLASPLTSRVFKEKKTQKKINFPFLN